MCTVLYILVALTLTGLVPYRLLDVGDPIAVAVNAAGPKLQWLRPIVKIGALFGLTSVICVLIMGMARVLYAMAADGCLPAALGRIHPVYKTPFLATLFTGLLSAFISGVLPVNVLSEMVSIGTLVAFVAVCVGVLALRESNPAMKRPFTVPYSPWVPAAGALLAIAQIAALPPATLWQLLIWAFCGLLFYWFWVRHHQVAWEVRFPPPFLPPRPLLPWLQARLPCGAGGRGRGEKGGQAAAGEGRGAAGEWGARTETQR